MVTVEDRSAATLIPIIKQYIRPGTKIISGTYMALSTIQFNSSILKLEITLSALKALGDLSKDLFLEVAQ